VRVRSVSLAQVNVAHVAVLLNTAPRFTRFTYISTYHLRYWRHKCVFFL